MHWDPVQLPAVRRPSGAARSRTCSAESAARASPAVVVDLGCGPGNLTPDAGRRWPAARDRGRGQSPEMVARAGRRQHRDRVTFTVGDLREWRPAEPVDVLVSNATLQWVPGHLDLLPALVAPVRPAGGWPSRSRATSGSRRTPRMALSPRRRGGRDRFAGRDRDRPAVETRPTTSSGCAGLGCAVDAWETTYLHVLPGADAVVRWVSGTGLRPYLQALDDEQTARSSSPSTAPRWRTPTRSGRGGRCCRSGGSSLWRSDRRAS